MTTPPALWRTVAELAVWWVALLATYLLLISTVTVVEVGVGAVLAGLVAAAGVVATRPFGAAARPRGIGWRSLCWFPLDLLRDLLVLARALAGQVTRRRRRVGGDDEVVLAPRGADEATSLRTYAVLLLSTAPGCFVTDVSVRRGEPDRLSVHRMSAPARYEAAVER